jgi:emericellamide synthase (highly reducing iterative type I polyketide synthase)
MTYQEWNASLGPKVAGTRNLHVALGHALDFFVTMSSGVALTGNLGQCNYGAACSFQDALMRRRVASGLPGFSINVGPVLEVGYVSENLEVALTLRRRGLGCVSIEELMYMLNFAVIGNHGPSSVGREGSDPTRDSVCSIGLVAGRDETELGETTWMRDRRFVHLRRHHKADKKVPGGSTDVLRQLGGADGFEEAAGIVCDAILQQLGKLIASPLEMLSAARSLDSYGVDSLVAVELRNWVGTYLQANIPLMVLRGTGSIRELGNIVAKESRLVNL